MKYMQLYVHIPFCVKKCSYCDFLSFSCDEKTQMEYADALMREIEAYGLECKDYMVDTIYIGGGTPSWLNEDKLVEIMDTIYRNFMVLTDAEVSMECNPGTVTASKLQKYRMAGINRLSIGLQSADNEELKILGRIHTFEQFIKTYELARNAGFSNINVDIISGIPYQTTEKFLKTLQKVVRLKPNHISAYSLIIEKGTPFYDSYKFDAVKQEAGMQTEVLPTEDEVYRIYKMTQDYLKRAGYEQYEISNFAQPGFECEHNIGYWTRRNYLGLGLGAASLIENVRYTNTKDFYEYMKNPKEGRVAEAVSRKAQMEEFMFLGLRMNAGVTRERFFREFGISIDGIYKDVLEHMKAEGLLYVGNGQIRLTDRGMDLGNYVMSQFLIDN
ncbi:MAG: radical SAM family heme chaperone HemW [Agathobacter sp.]